MPEACRCKCGSESWKIFAGYIKCVNCGEEYNLPDYFIYSHTFIDISKFNQERNKEKQNGVINFSKTAG